MTADVHPDDLRVLALMVDADQQREEAVFAFGSCLPAAAIIPRAEVK
jgi:hypothetical protein